MLTSNNNHCFVLKISANQEKEFKIYHDIYDDKFWCLFSDWLKFSNQKQRSLIVVSIIWCNTVYYYYHYFEDLKREFWWFLKNLFFLKKSFKLKFYMKFSSLKDCYIFFKACANKMSINLILCKIWEFSFFAKVCYFPRRQ
jgi:hypothetical protein